MNWFEDYEVAALCHGDSYDQCYGIRQLCAPKYFAKRPIVNLAKNFGYVQTYAQRFFLPYQFFQEYLLYDVTYDLQYVPKIRQMMTGIDNSIQNVLLYVGSYIMTKSLWIKLVSTPFRDEHNVGFPTMGRSLSYAQEILRYKAFFGLPTVYENIMVKMLLWNEKCNQLGAKMDRLRLQLNNHNEINPNIIHPRRTEFHSICAKYKFLRLELTKIFNIRIEILRLHFNKNNLPIVC
jgi:hypothetical protein